MPLTSTSPAGELAPAQRYMQLVEHASAARAAGQLAQAAQLYGEALAIDDRQTRCHLEYGEVLLRMGERLKALPHLQRAAHEYQHPAVRTLYAETLSKIRFGRTDPTLKLDLQNALDGSWLRPADLAGVSMSLLRFEYALAPDGAAHQVESATGLVVDPLLHALLRTTPNTDEALEHWLTAARAALLAQVIDSKASASASLLAFAVALAKQSWVAEFVLPVTPEEAGQVQTLHAMVHGCVALGGRPDELALAVLASYQWLLEGKLEQLLWLEFSPGINRLLTWHLRNPQRERVLAQQVPALTAIDDAISHKVRAQYEEHPFPRWIAAPVNAGRTDLREYVATCFPALAARRPANGSAVSEVLVAGCGTGQQPVGTVSSFSNVKVLAVDLCLASLGYARRMCVDMGIENIDFAQADILQLGQLDRHFDLIECGGVLHHLGDPERGWRVLCGLLKPHGLMAISLYSRSARTDLDPARALIRAQAIAPTDAGIRKFRQRVMALPPSDPCRQLVLRRDFYTISMLRDLVFHVNEHEYDLMQIGAMAERLGLSLLRIDVPPETEALFRTQFGAHSALNDLPSWHALEQLHPSTFRGMYQMWFCKK